MTVYDVVKKLIGPTMPIGSSAEDRDRLANLESKIQLAEALLEDIRDVAEVTHIGQHSLVVASERAHKFLKVVKESLD